MTLKRNTPSHNTKERVIMLLRYSEPLPCREIVARLAQNKIGLGDRHISNRYLPTTRAMHQLLKKDNRFLHRFDEKAKINLWELRGD